MVFEVPILRNLPVSSDRIDAVMRMLVDEGEATPTAQRILQKVTDEERKGSLMLTTALRDSLLAFYVDARVRDPRYTALHDYEKEPDVSDLVTRTLDAIMALVTLEITPREYMTQADY